MIQSGELDCTEVTSIISPNHMVEYFRETIPPSIGIELRWQSKEHAVIETGRLTLELFRKRRACMSEVSARKVAQSQTDKQILEIVELVELGNPREAVRRFHVIADPNDPSLASHHVDILSAVLAGSAVGDDSGAFVNFLYNYLITYIGNSGVEDVDAQVKHGVLLFETNVGSAFQALELLAMRGSLIANVELAKGLARWRELQWARILAEYYAIQSIGLGMDAQYLLDALNAEDHLYFPRDQIDNLIGTTVTTWFEQYAVQLNSPVAQHRIGWFLRYHPRYTQHTNLSLSDRTLLAVSWFEKSAEQGNLDSMFELATIHSDPYGVAPDEEEADRLLQLAASYGHGSSIAEIDRKKTETEKRIARNKAADRARIKAGGEQERCLEAPQRYALEKLRDFELVLRTSYSNGGRCAEMARAWEGQLSGLKEVYDSRVLFQDSSEDPSWCRMAKNIRHYEDTYRQQLEPTCL